MAEVLARAFPRPSRRRRPAGEGRTSGRSERRRFASTSTVRVKQYRYLLPAQRGFTPCTVRVRVRGRAVLVSLRVLCLLANFGKSRTTRSQHESCTVKSRTQSRFKFGGRTCGTQHRLHSLTPGWMVPFPRAASMQCSCPLAPPISSCTSRTRSQGKGFRGSGFCSQGSAQACTAGRVCTIGNYCCGLSNHCKRENTQSPRWSFRWFGLHIPFYFVLGGGRRCASAAFPSYNDGHALALIRAGSDPCTCPLPLCRHLRSPCWEALSSRSLWKGP